jgi:membrane fusion protein (multidrug efflux system)
MDLKRLRINESANPEAVSIRTKCLIAGIVGLIVGLTIGLGLGSVRSGKAISVDTSIVGSAGGGSAKIFTAGGWIEAATPQYPIILSSRISQRLDKLSVRQGDTVKSGQTVCQLYDGDLRAKLALAEARSSEAEEQFRIAAANYNRSKDLRAGILSDEELDQELSTMNTAKKASAAVQASLDLAKQGLGYCTISVPENLPPLRVLDVMHKPGDWISPEKGAGVVSLYDPQDIHMRVDVPQTGIRSVSIGQQVTIRTEAQSETKYTGIVFRIDPLAELSKNTITVRIKIDNPDLMLFPEMVAHATFLAKASVKKGVSGATVPLSAVLGEDDDRYVYLYKNGRAVRQSVTVAKIEGSRAQVSEGLSSGQKIIVSNLDELSDGQAVEKN